MEGNTGDDIFFFEMETSFLWRNRPTGAYGAPLLTILDDTQLGTAG